MKSPSRQRRIRPLKAKAADATAEFDNYGAEPNMKLSHAFMVVLALHVVAVGGLFAFNKVKAGHSKISEKLQTEVAAGKEALATEEVKPLVPAPVHEVAKEVKQEVTKVVEEAAIAPSKTKEQTPSVAQKKVATAPVVPTSTATKSAFLATKTVMASTAVAPSATSPAVAAVATMARATATAAEVAASAPQAPQIETSVATEYTIVKGDNPYKIAKRFHVPYDQLIKFNNISDPRKMQIGQKIKIPKKR